MAMASSNGKLVCVTGGTGYIASWIVRELLQRGYTVHTTARNPDDPAKVGFLWDLPGAKERLRIFKADLLEPGSFDAALSGVYGVIHVAGVVLIDPKDDPQLKLVETSTNGVLNVLGSCTKFSSIAKVVLTSSCSAIRYDHHHQTGKNDSLLDESSWTNPGYCSQHKLWYPLAKTLAERTAWDFSKLHGINLVVVNPSFIVGPLLQPVPTSTILIVLGMLKGHIKLYPNMIVGFVHIQDVVAAHLLAYESPDAAGRYICSERVAHWREVLEMLRAKYPQYPLPSEPSQDQGQDIPHEMSAEKLKQLGLESYQPLEKMFDDCIESLKLKGFLE
ncbi:tetraketide alpha-pyrone reductase 2 [Selaginella moellendorffii]|nr:tetraketide alpha-pyrone reductase 2 [Selaginella moellendorffii]|eukprot:XP_002992359.2 tetraketide alpha-pyrone reductase 2 [Selaginella moellendorffii]